MFDDFPDEPAPADMQRIIGEFARSFQLFRDGLVAVGPPEGQAGDYDEYVGLIEGHLAALRRRADDPAEAERLFNEEGDDPLRDLEERLGLDLCASR